MEDSAGLKYDKGKPRLELLPPSYWESVESFKSAEMARWYLYERKFPASLHFDPVPILEYGCIKYSSHNWLSGMRWGRLVGAFHRHCNKIENGLWVPRALTEIDKESGLMHGQHAECCRVFLLEYYKRCIAGFPMGENDCAWAE